MDKCVCTYVYKAYAQEAQHASSTTGSLDSTTGARKRKIKKGGKKNKIKREINAEKNQVWPVPGEPEKNIK